MMSFFNSTHIYISILDFFQGAKNCKPNKGLDSPAPGQVQMTQAMLHRPPKSANSIISAFKKILRQVHSCSYTNSNEECVFPYKHDLKSKKTIFVGINGLFSVSI